MSTMTKAQLLAKIAELEAAAAAATSTPVEVAPIAAPDMGSMSLDTRLGTKQFSRPILELILIEQDWRSDEEAARGILLSFADCSHRARAWGFERRAYWTTQFGGPIAISQTPEFVPAISGAWPTQCGNRATGSYYAIY